MELSTQDYLKKALLDTQERVRDFMSYADRVEDRELRQYFRNYAESEGQQAQQLRGFIEEKCK